MENPKKDKKTWLFITLALMGGMVGGYAIGTRGTFKMAKKEEQKTVAELQAELQAAQAAASGIPVGK